LWQYFRFFLAYEKGVLKPFSKHISTSRHYFKTWVTSSRFRILNSYPTNFFWRCLLTCSSLSVLYLIETQYTGQFYIKIIEYDRSYWIYGRYDPSTNSFVLFPPSSCLFEPCSDEFSLFPTDCQNVSCLKHKLLCEKINMDRRRLISHFENFTLLLKVSRIHLI
jgi:hypothetical protein